MITDQDARLVVTKLRKIAQTPDLNGIVFWGPGIWEEILRATCSVNDTDATPDTLGRLGCRDYNLGMDAIQLKTQDSDLLFKTYQEVLEYVL